MNFFEIHKYPSRKNFPVYGNINRLYIDLESNKFYYWEDGKYFKISTVELDQATYDDIDRKLSGTYETIVNSDNKLALKADKTYVDTKVDKPAGSPNNYFSESNEYLPLQRFARVRYQSTSGWAKVAEVTLPASADERKSAIFFINCENNTSTTSEGWFGILEWNIHETPASNSIKWLVTYGFGENNFNIRYHSDTNTLSFFVLPTVGNMNLWLASESTNGRVTSDIVLFDAANSTPRTGLSVAAKADYLTHAGHVRNTRKVAGIALSGDISAEALINALKANDSSDTDKLATVELVADMFAELVNGAPAALDTLQELAQALNNDSNFASTVTNLIGTKLSKVDAQNTYETIVNSDNKLALKADKTYVDDIVDSLDVIAANTLVKVTWQELKDKRDLGLLTPGAQYRITDYECTTTQANTQSAGHQFDIIVVADDVNKLNENARACLHEGDTYFANSKLEAWKLKYCLDNDVNRFAWAQKEYLEAYGDTYVYVDKRTVSLTHSGNTEVYFWVHSDSPHMAVGTLIKPIEVGVTEIHSLYSDDEGVTWYEDDAIEIANFYQAGGKGVIYRMIDEFNNDVPYDFKNIQFKRKLTDGELDPVSGVDTWCYTFTGISYEYSTLIDGTVLKASEYFTDEGSNLYKNNKIGIHEYKRFAEDGYDKIVQQCNDIVFIGRYDEEPYTEEGPAKLVLFSFNNVLGAQCSDMTFGANCHSNTFDNSCYSNTFGNNCSYNTFGNNCYSNTFGNGCSSNTFGNGCSSNTFGNDCYNNTFGNACYNNTFGNGCYNNTFGNGCSNNTFGNYYYYNTFGSNCSNNTFGNVCYNNTFGNDCRNNTFGNVCSSNTFGNACAYLRISDNTSAQKKHIHVENGTQGASSVNQFDLYDPAIYNKNYQVTFKKSASGKYLMLWATDTGTMTGKVKDSNVDDTWTELE